MNKKIARERSLFCRYVNNDTSLRLCHLEHEQPHRLLTLNHDVHDMGNDGGSIPDRRDLVKTKAKVHSSTILTKA